MSVLNVKTLLRDAPLKQSIARWKNSANTSAASVACILRINNLNCDLPNTGTTNVLEELESLTSSSNWTPTLELLLIQRAHREGDVWSGDTALPGGKLEMNESDYAAAIRETKEEIGLDLEEEGVLYLGRLQEKSFSLPKGVMTITPNLFLDTRKEPRPMTLQPSEVARAFFTQLDDIDKPSAQYKIDLRTRYLSRLEREKRYFFLYLARAGLFLTQVKEIVFPCIFLSPPSAAEREEVPRAPALWGMTYSICKNIIISLRRDNDKGVLPSHLRQGALPFTLGTKNSLLHCYLLGWHSVLSRFELQNSNILLIAFSLSSFALTSVLSIACVSNYIFTMVYT